MIHNDFASGLRASILRVGALPMQLGVAAVLRDFDTDQVGLSHGLPLVAARMALPQGSAANMGTVKRSTRLFMDETRAPVLDPGAGKTKTGYLWALTRDDRGWCGGDPPAVVFTYAPGRSGSHAMNILLGFDGILQVDGYTGYDALAEPRRVGGKPLTLAYCWAHSRRKLHDIYQKDSSEIAAEGLRRIAQLYKIEASIRRRAPEERLAARQAQSAPLVADFRRWLTHQRSRISAKSRLGEKLGYIHRHWDGLQILLTDGRVEMDTNTVENTIRPITLNRKNPSSPDMTRADALGPAWPRSSKPAS